MEKTPARTFRTEFPNVKLDPRFESLVLLGHLTDTSWHNDAGPSFTVHDKSGMTIWVKSPDEGGTGKIKTYTVSLYDEAGNWLSNAIETDNLDDLFSYMNDHWNISGDSLTDAMGILIKWVREIGVGFHPDTRGKDYDPPLSDPAAYDAELQKAQDEIGEDDFWPWVFLAYQHVTQNG